MSASLKTKFNGNAQEVIEYVRLWGKFKAMEKYGVRDYVAFSKFIEDKTDNPNFGLRPTLGGMGNAQWAEDLLDAFLNKIHKMEAEKQSLEDELHRVKLEVQYYKGQQVMKIEPKISQVMAECRV